MQKDFKIGLAIGAFLAAGTVVWLATLPNLSARARAIQAASNAVSPQPKDAIAPAPSIEHRESSIENQVSSIQTPDTNNEPQTVNNEIRNTNDEIRARIHIVQRGDTLSSISAKYYGSSKQWRKIVAANRNNLSDPNRLTPGIKLIIPD
jgi:5'-nucleotidase/UDP-sugar diphosphatase